MASEYTEQDRANEGCCWTWQRDQCPGAGCRCVCHMSGEPVRTTYFDLLKEIEGYRQRSRDEDTARIRLNHARIEAEERAAKAKAERDDALARLAAAEAALPDPGKLWSLATWLDGLYPNDVNPEVQSDLRAWARRIHALRLHPDSWVVTVETSVAMAGSREQAASVRGSFCCHCDGSGKEHDGSDCLVCDGSGCYTHRRPDSLCETCNRIRYSASRRRGEGE